MSLSRGSEIQKPCSVCVLQEEDLTNLLHHLRLKVSKSSIGETHLEMDFSIGLPPETVFDIVTSHDNQTYSYFKQMKRRKILVFFLFSFLLIAPFLLSSDYSNT